MRHLEVDRVKEEVVELYEVWDKLSLELGSRLAAVEEAGARLRRAEAELGEVSRFLGREAGRLLEDSGYSGSELRLDCEGLGEQQQRLEAVRRSVAVADTPASSQLTSILAALGQSSRQLQQLSSLVADKTKFKRRSSKVTTTSTSLPPPRSPSWSKVSRYWWRMTMLLAMMILTSVLITPNCCEYSNSLYLILPSITTTGGMRPI